MTARPVGAAGLALLDERTPDQVPLAGRAEAVRTLVLAERTAKDLEHWDVMEAAFAPRSRVRVSWFEGTGAEFVAGTRARAARGSTSSFHKIGAVSVVVNGRRALADAPCAVHVRASLDGPEADLVSRGRVCWRVEETGGRWWIASLDMIYVRDALTPATPGAALPALAAPEDDRPSYGLLQRVMARSGYPVSPTLPGTDRPHLVDDLLAAHRDWFFATGAHTGEARDV